MNIERRLAIRVIPLLILIGLPLTVHARIGWTLEQCIAQYGPITFQKVQAANQGTAYWFEKNDPQVNVTILNNRVEGIAYEKQSKGEFYQPDFDAFSAENLPDGAKWEKDGPATFASKGGDRVLFRTYVDHVISFYTVTELRLMYESAPHPGHQNDPKKPGVTPSLVSATATPSNYAPRPEEIEEFARGFQFIWALTSLGLYWFSLRFFRTKWKRWTFWACCIGVFSLLGLLTTPERPNAALNIVEVYLCGVFYLACLQAIRWAIRWMLSGWPGRPKDGKKASFWWFTLKGVLVALFGFAILWHYAEESHTPDQSDATYASGNGQVVMKYDSSKWQEVKQGSNNASSFRLVRKSNSDISIYVFSGTDNSHTLEQLIDHEKAALQHDYGTRCVFKKELGQNGPVFAGLLFAVDEGMPNEERILVTLGLGQAGYFILILTNPEQGQSNPEVTKAFYTFCSTEFHVL